jgi:peptidoglycan hydrolase-like protein with peptidoglycan-binding domain
MEDVMRGVSWFGLGTLALLLSACSGEMNDTVAAGTISEQELRTETDAPLNLASVQRDLAAGSSGEDVRQATRFFIRYGYFDNPTLHERFPRWSAVVGGVPASMNQFGAQLEAAVLAYQEQNGLPPTGAIDGKTLEVMRQRTCEHPDSFDNGSEKWAHWDAQGFQSDNVFTYRVTGYPGTPSNASIDAAVAAAMAAWAGPTVLTTQAQASGTVDAEIRWENFPDTDGALARGGGKLVRFNTDYTWTTSGTSGYA